MEEMKTLETFSTRWAMQHCLGRVGVLMYYAPRYNGDGYIVYDNESYIYIYKDNNGKIFVYDMGEYNRDNMIPYKSGMIINGIKIIIIDPVQKAMYPDNPAMTGMNDDAFEVTFEFITPLESIKY